MAAGNDTFIGGDGTDFFTGGAGNDIFTGAIDNPKTATKNGPISFDVITDFTTGDKIDLSGIDAKTGVAGDQAFTFNGSSANKNAGDLTFKMFDSINGAENALGFDIDGVSGKGAAGAVTVVFGNVDGGNPDFAIVLLGGGAVTSSDFFL